MAIKFLTRVGSEEIYRITTTSGKKIKVSIATVPDPEDSNVKIWNAFIWYENRGEWKLFMNEPETICPLPEFVQKVDLILAED